MRALVLFNMNLNSIFEVYGLKIADSWATVCKTVRPMLSVRCLSVCPVCLSVYDVRALSPNCWTDKTKLGMQVGLGPGNIVLDGDPAPLS